VGSGRTQRLLGGLGLGYLHTAGAMLVGLWLTPFLLGELGSHDYGLWLLGTQIVFYLALMDLGVVALVPREIAAASGLPVGERTAAIQKLVGQAGRLALWQVPAVAIAGGVVVWTLPSDWAPLRGPVGVVVVTFVLAFPFRALIATLQGLQDLAFVGAIQLVSWSAGTAVTISCVLAGVGLYSLSFGWITTQVVSIVMAWMRMSRSFADLVPRPLPGLTFSDVCQQLGRGVWISVAQVAQVLLTGIDIVVIGRLLGPAAVVSYVCTGKLISLLANQPQMFMQLALPALSELRTSAPRARLLEVSRNMTLVMMLGSGAIATVVLAVNEPFVSWWVGDAHYGGTVLTVLLLVSMLARHLNVTAVYALFCFGNERRLAITTLADGLVGVVAMLLLIPVFGVVGAVIGSLLATVVVSLPNNLSALAREEGTSADSLLLPLGPWIARLGILLGSVTVLLSVSSVRGLPGLVLTAAVGGTAYSAVMFPLLRRPPLGDMLSSVLQKWIKTVPGFQRRPVSQPLTLNQPNAVNEAPR
jgi:O-antigen/teichoic acid export membrane protein